MVYLSYPKMKSIRISFSVSFILICRPAAQGLQAIKKGVVI